MSNVQTFVFENKGKTWNLNYVEHESRTFVMWDLDGNFKEVFWCKEDGVVGLLHEYGHKLSGSQDEIVAWKTAVKEFGEDCFLPHVDLIKDCLLSYDFSVEVVEKAIIDIFSKESPVKKPVTTYTFKFTCGSKKNIERIICSEDVLMYIDSLVQVNLEKEAKGLASAFIVDVIRNTEGKEPISVRKSVLTAYYASLRDARNILRTNLLMCKDNPVIVDGKVVAYYLISEDAGEKYFSVIYTNGLVKSDKAFKDMDEVELSLVS